MSLHIRSNWIERGETIAVRNKYDGTVIERVSIATERDVKDAIDTARAATGTAQSSSRP